MKNILIGTLKFILYVAFVIAAIYFTPKLLSKWLHTPYPLATITSGSMWPVLKENDLILMQGVSGKDVQVGQIIIFKNAGGFTIHRLIRKEDNGMLVTKGDANDVEDKPISENDIIGRIVYFAGRPFRIPYLGFISRSIGPKITEFEKNSNL
jgi:signal peptidase I